MSFEEGDEDWGKCSDWLMRTGVLNFQQRSSITSVEHLASLLKDGVILCNLLNILKPKSISSSDFCQKPQASTLLCQKNIRVFLRTCENQFKIKNKSLFEVDQLYQMHNFGNVISTLSQISSLFSKKIEPFSVENETNYDIEEDIMDEVENEYSCSLYGIGGEKGEYGSEQEEIYDHFINMKQPKSCYVTLHEKNKKEFVVEELVVTEKNFLQIIDRIYKYFSKEMEKKLSRSEYSSIFLNLDEIKKVHKDFYKNLTRAQSSQDPIFEVARCFRKVYKPFVIYAQYCAELPEALNKLEKVLSNNPSLNQVVEKGNVEARVKLHDLILIPSQRILKYHLILSSMKKACSNDKKELDEIKNSLSIMEDIGFYINECKRDYEAIINIREIQKNIKDIEDFSKQQNDKLRLEDYGRRHFDGEFQVKDMSFDNKFKNRYLCVFDKLLLICKPYKEITKQNEYYYYKISLEISNCDFSCEISNKDIQQIEIMKKDTLEKFLITSKKITQLTKLMNCFSIAKDNTCPSGYNQYLLTNFKNATFCSVCEKLLRGLISQGYLCRNTGKIVHKECLESAVKEEKIDHHDKLPRKKPNQKPPFSPKPRVAPVPPPPLEEKKLSPNKKFSNLESYPWFSDADGRKTSANLLRNCPMGTFLVRWSSEQKAYVLSLKFDQIRHMLIKSSDNRYYFKESRPFNSISQLIEYYKINSLEGAFSKVQTSLGSAYKEIKIEKCVALYNFSAVDGRQLTFRQGDVITILNKSTGVGLWRGEINGKKGTFPSSYVEVID